ncbi:DUF2935 domain-containing protein [Alteribacillus iranensis]|uniref:DUF2935 domain-containing protein n=1 Tax=Alteribacillus iranensis TaxID=930128 RepID=A0A1I2EWF5_9BACI|nr:DUF2935 domain-containing protein [Alteribacillus iranensis]SFE97109.1 protein of unknown function [Alteribacillus iranensis]
MQFYYGQQMPLRMLDEAEFWKHQEEEHTVVIRELIPQLEDVYVNALKKWEEVLGETRQQVLQFIEIVISSNQIPYFLFQRFFHFVSFWLRQSQQFIELCHQLKRHSEPIRENPTANIVIDHIIRESEYFTGIAQALLYNQPSLNPAYP